MDNQIFSQPTGNNGLPSVDLKSQNENVFKPKGLAMRSTFLNTNDATSPNKNLSQKLSPHKIGSRPLSPYRKLLLQKQTVRFEKKKELFIAKRKESKKNVYNGFGSGMWNVQRLESNHFEYFEQENLAHEFDDSIYEDMELDSPFRNLIIQDEDEGFISDPDFLPEDDLPPIYPNYMIEEEIEVPELPDIPELPLSDSEDP